jgi:predicted DNA-binding transcriptional regulator YafY
MTKVIIDYTNWRGERRTRTINPECIRFASSQWHTEEQWLLSASDCDTNEDREFAMKDIHSWEPTP